MLNAYGVCSQLIYMRNYADSYMFNYFNDIYKGWYLLADSAQLRRM